jgi:TPR repeat protein
MVGLANMQLFPESDKYDPTAAADWLQKAAETESPISAEAEFTLARLHEKGIGVTPDPARALQLYQSSAAKDYPDAVNELGFFYFNGGLGLPIDQAKALTLFRQAADLDHPEALFNVASFIDDGYVADAGPDEAAAYLYRAIRLGSENVLEALTNQSQSFKPETRKALQKQLLDNGFYTGTLDGDFGPGTIKSLRMAFGLIG